MGTVYNVTATSDETCGGLSWDNTNRLITVTGPSGGALASGLRFATAPGSGTNIFNSYFIDTQVYTWQGPLATNPTSNVTYEINGDDVLVSIAPFSAVAGGTNTFISATTALPTNVRPAIDRFGFVFIEIGNNILAGVVCIRTNGNIEASVGTPDAAGALQVRPNGPGTVNHGLPLGAQIIYSLTNT